MDGDDNFIVRLATPEDYLDVVAIDPDIYEGYDYLPDKYHTFLRDNTRVACVACLDGKVVGFAQIQLVNEGSGLIGRTARLSKEARDKGYWKQFRFLMFEYVQQKWPDYVMDAHFFLLFDDFKQPFAHSKPKWRTYVVRDRINIDIPQDLSKLQLEHNLPPLSGNITRSLSSEEVCMYLKNLDLCFKFFPAGYLIINWMTFHPKKPGNQLYIASLMNSKQLTVMGTFTAGSNLLQSISFLSSVKAPKGLVQTIDYYGMYENDIVHHLYHHIKDTYSTWCTGGRYYIVHFDMKMNKDYLLSLIHASWVGIKAYTPMIRKNQPTRCSMGGFPSILDSGPAESSKL